MPLQAPRNTCQSNQDSSGRYWICHDSCDKQSSYFMLLTHKSMKHEQQFTKRNLFIYISFYHPAMLGKVTPLHADYNKQNLCHTWKLSTLNLLFIQL